MKVIHDNEILALKEAHSHTRMLSESSLCTKTLLQNVSHFQARVGGSRERQRQEKEHGLIAKQRLEAGKSETSKEQERLHSLIAILETELKAQQSAYDTVKGTSLQGIQEYRNQLQPAKKKFLRSSRRLPETRNWRSRVEKCRLKLMSPKYRSDIKNYLVQTTGRTLSS